MDWGDALKVSAIFTALVLIIATVVNFSQDRAEGDGEEGVFVHGLRLSPTKFAVTTLDAHRWLIFDECAVRIDGPEGISVRSDLERGMDLYRSELGQYEITLMVQDNNMNGAADAGDGLLVQSNVSMPLGAWTVLIFSKDVGRELDRITVVMSDPTVTPIGFLSPSRKSSSEFQLEINAFQPVTAYSQCFLLVQLGDGWRTIWLNYSQTDEYAYNDSVSIKIDCRQGDGVISPGDRFIIKSSYPFPDATRTFSIYHNSTEGRIATTVF